jgi:hypothetical protein
MKAGAAGSKRPGMGGSRADLPCRLPVPGPGRVDEDVLARNTRGNPAPGLRPRAATHGASLEGKTCRLRTHTADEGRRSMPCVQLSSYILYLAGPGTINRGAGAATLQLTGLPLPAVASFSPGGPHLHGQAGYHRSICTTSLNTSEHPQNPSLHAGRLTSAQLTHKAKPLPRRSKGATTGRRLAKGGTAQPGAAKQQAQATWSSLGITAARQRRA